jgi:hypothetical protein
MLAMLLEARLGETACVVTGAAPAGEVELASVLELKLTVPCVGEEDVVGRPDEELATYGGTPDWVGSGTESASEILDVVDKFVDDGVDAGTGGDVTVETGGKREVATGAGGCGCAPVGEGDGIVCSGGDPDGGGEDAEISGGNWVLEEIVEAGSLSLPSD